MSKLAEIRAKLKAAEDRKNQVRDKSSSDKLSYPFWDMEPGKSTLVRFLPDKNPDNTYFWVERQLIKLPFKGIKGGDENKEVVIQVPCMDMWGEQCPVMREVSPWFNDPQLESMARQYWKKRTYIFQGIVREDPLNEADKPENPVRKFVVSPQVHKVIIAALLSPDMDGTEPTDYLNGLDFRISKTKNGKYADYGTSAWSRRETALSEDELSAINEYGLQDLSTYLPEKPSAEHVKVIYEMFQASIDGELYDPEKWANFYKPYGLDTRKLPGQTSNTATATATATVATVTDDSDQIPFDTASPTHVPSTNAVATSNNESEAAHAEADKPAKDAASILAMIRNRGTSA